MDRPGALPLNSLPTLDLLRQRLHCAYCRDEMTSPPMLMGRNCAHAICASCRDTFFRPDDGARDPDARPVLSADAFTVCPLCDSPIEKAPRSDHDGMRFFEVLKSVKNVISSFDEFLSLAQALPNGESEASGVSSVVVAVDDGEEMPAAGRSSREAAGNDGDGDDENNDEPSPRKGVRRKSGRQKSGSSSSSSTVAATATATPTATAAAAGPGGRRKSDEKQGAGIFFRGKDLEKRNAKGETPLHAAVIKNRLEDVKSYLGAGASSNVRDNAGWTPLHESCSLGFRDMTEVLLNAGAMVNVPGGDNNETPLHDAVQSGRKDIVALLMANGADPGLCNSSGINAFDMAAGDEELARILRTGSRVDPVVRAGAAVVSGSAVLEPVFAYCDISQDKLRCLQRVCKEQRWKKPTDEVLRETTMLITRCPLVNGIRRARINCRTLQAAVTGKLLLDKDLIPALRAHYAPDGSEDVPGSGSDSVPSPSPSSTTPLLTIDSLKPLTADCFAGLPDSGVGLQRARESAAGMLPPLFDGFRVFVVGCGAEFELEDCHGLTRHELSRVLSSAGATILHREPDPGKIDRSAGGVKLPYHAANGPLAYTTHLIVYPPSKKPNICYNMAELKALPVAWVIACITAFRIVDPAPFVAS